MLSFADVADQGARRVGVELDSLLPAARDHPFGQLPRLHAHLRADLAADRAHQRVEPLRRPAAAVLAGEEGHRGVGRDRLNRRLERVQILVLPPLGAVDDDEPPAERERHRIERERDRVGARLVALEQLQPLRSAERFGEPTQAGTALCDAAVVIAVNQVRGLERRHPQSSLWGGKMDSSRAGSCGAG